MLAAAAFSAQGRNDVDAMREYSEAALRDGVPPDCPGAVWAYIASAANEGMRGDWQGAIRVITDARAALQSAGGSPRGLSFLYPRPPTSTTCWATSTRRRATPSFARRGAPVAEPDRDRQRAVRSRGGAQSRRSASGGCALDESITIGRLGTSGGLLGFALARRSVLRADKPAISPVRAATSAKR